MESAQPVVCPVSVGGGSPLTRARSAWRSGDFVEAAGLCAAPVLRALAVAATASLVAWVTYILMMYATPVRFGGPRMQAYEYCMMKVVMMLIASWSAVRCLRRSASGGTGAAFVNAVTCGLLASFLFSTWWGWWSLS